MNFNSDFIWGVASSAYQIEGAYDRDGKGSSIWDTFCNSPGNIRYNETGNTACCHYDNYKQDIDLMHKLGIKAYRFSIAWTRIFPMGDNKLNKKGLEFYDNLVNYCLNLNITPFITLFHWDLPQTLEDNGGWLNRDTVIAFSKYAAFIVKHFSDRVSNFITINEPQIISYFGYYRGIYAPGKKCSRLQTLNVLHNLALAHGLAVMQMRKNTVKPIKIGFASTGNLCYPIKASSYKDTHNITSSGIEYKSEDIDSARATSFTTTADNIFFNHHIFCDMVCLGTYPEIKNSYLENIFREEFNKSLPSKFKYKDFDFVQPEDIDIMNQKIDFVGFNIYFGHEVNSNGYITRASGFPKTALKWPITPEVMNWGVRFLYERYHLPIYITENGLSCNDVISIDGKVHDSLRIDFLSRYIAELEKAQQSGVKLLGYFHWSFTDNFEWSNGYDERFGLVYVDYTTMKRIPKDSAFWYKSLIENKVHIH